MAQLAFKIPVVLTACSLIFSSCNSPSGPQLVSADTTEKKEEREKQALRINLREEPQTLDPQRGRELSSLTLMRLLFEGLTRIGPDEKPELALADELEISEDGLTYTFGLRGVTWTNGDPLSAEDFVYAWKRVLNPSFPGDNAFQLYVIKNAKAVKEGVLPAEELGVRAIDRWSLEVKLERPTPYFLELLASPVFFPINQKVDRDNPNWAENASTYVSNGPFVLDKWKHNYQLNIKKNPNYWDKQAVHLSEIQFAMVQEETELKMFEKNELDWAGSPLSTLPVDALRDLKKQGLLYTQPFLGTYFMRTNTELLPFNDQNVRKAFALAINRRAIVEHITQGNQTPATGLVPVSLDLQEEPYFRDGNVQEARILFETALRDNGWTKETFPPVTLLYAMSQRNHLIAQAVQEQWERAFGIRIRLEGIETKVYFNRVSKQDFQIASGSWIADFGDPINFLEVFKFKKASTNNTSWGNKDFARLLDRSMETRDVKQRIRLLRKSEQLIMDAMPIIPIFHYTMLYVKNEKVKGVRLSSLGNIDFKTAYIEEEKEIAKR